MRYSQWCVIMGYEDYSEYVDYMEELIGDDVCTVEREERAALVAT